MDDESSINPLADDIAAARRAVADAERALEKARITLSVWEQVAAKFAGSPLMPKPPRQVSPRLPFGDAPPTRRGKAPGTLSNQWRTIMEHVVLTGNRPSSPLQWSDMALVRGFNIEEKSVRDWLRRAAESEYHYIERIGDSYRVSDTAIQKFGFKTAEPPQEVPSGGSE